MTVKTQTCEVSSPSRRLQLLAKFLSYFVLGFGVFTIFTTVRIVIEGYSPVMFWDHWEIVRTLMNSRDHVTLGQLWSQHNEHRIPIGRLFCFADLFLFGGKNISLLLEILAVQFSLLLVFAWAISRLGRLHHLLFTTALGFLAYCFFSPLQIQNFLLGFQVTFVCVNLGAVLTIVFAIWCARLSSRSFSWRVSALSLCLLSAFIAEGSLASGLLIWPVLFVVFFLLGLPKRYYAVLALASGAAITMYFYGYSKAGSSAGLGFGPSTINSMIKFIITELAWSWDTSLPNSSSWPLISESVSFFALAIALLYVIRCLRRAPVCSHFETFICGNLLFGLGGLALTALGRLRFGYEQATTSRYQSQALFFWACIGVVLADSLNRNVEAQRKLLVAHIGCCIVLASAASRYAPMRGWALGQRIGLARGWDALMQSSSDSAAIGGLYTDPAVLRRLFVYLKEHHWGPAGLLAADAWLQPGRINQVPDGYSLAPTSCSGFVDGVVAGNAASVIVWGWAYDHLSSVSATRVAVVSSTGKILTFAGTGINRPDVAKAIPETHSDTAGWTADLSAVHDGEYHVYVVNERSHTACVLSNGFIVRRQHSGK